MADQKMVCVEQHDQVVVWKLNHGATNAMGRAFVGVLSEELRRVREDPGVRALVLTGAGEKFFSIGLDIPDLLDLPRDEFTTFYRDLNRLCLELYALPKPTVAALTGHAIAGGCIVAMCCDRRLVAEGRKLMGVNEVKLGVPLPYLADCILRQVVGARKAWEIISTGEFYPPETLLSMGMVDQVLPLNEVLPAAIEQARALGALPAQAFALSKQNRVEPVLHEVLPRQEEKERSFIECWYAEETRERLKEAMARF